MNAIIFSVISGIIMMFSSVVVSNKGVHRHIAAACLVLILVMNVSETYGSALFNINVHDMLKFDKFGLFFNSIAIVSTLIYVLITGKDVQKTGSYPAEYFVLIFFSLCGVFILSSYNNLLMLFLGIEIMSIPLYILTGSDKRNLKSNEAALKYFLMGAFSTGLMLMGIALMYGGTGTFALNVERGGLQSLYMGVSFLEITGLLLLMVSMAFKVSAAPFHFWTPDVYDGAPSVFTSFMSTVSKAAGFIAFFKLCDVRMNDTASAIDWQLLFTILILATLLFGNITAVFQQSVKRMLAYSSIAQAGFMLFALFSLNNYAKQGLLMYAAAYCLSTIGIFAALIKMKDISFDGYNGLAKTQPVLAVTNTVFLLSLSGIPLTAGFWAKYYMLASVMQMPHYTWLAIVAVLFAAVSVYYYFRVIQSMYFKEGDAQTEEITPSFKFSMIALAALVILIGVMPQFLFNWLYF